MNLSGFLAFEMGMWLEIRAIPRRGTIEVHLLDESATDKSFQTIIYGCERNCGQFFLHTQKDVICSGMIPFGHDHLVDATSLLRRTQAMLLEGVCEIWIVIGYNIHDQIAILPNISCEARIIGIILIRKS